MKIDKQRYSAVLSILQESGALKPNSRMNAVRACLKILELPADFAPKENGCVVKTNSTYPMYITSGRTVSGQC